MQPNKETSMVRVSVELLDSVRKAVPEADGLTNTGVVDVALRRLLEHERRVSVIPRAVRERKEAEQ